MDGKMNDLMMQAGKQEKRLSVIINQHAGTGWLSKDLWVRRTFTLNKIDYNKLFLKIKHDDNIEVYLNGEKIYNYMGWLGKFRIFSY